MVVRGCLTTKGSQVSYSHSVNFLDLGAVVSPSSTVILTGRNLLPTSIRSGEVQGFEVFDGCNSKLHLIFVSSHLNAGTLLYNRVDYILVITDVKLL